MKNSKYLILFLLVWLLTSCGAIFKSTITVKNNYIPADFGKNNTVLLVDVSVERSISRYIRKAFEKNYKGEYHFITNRFMGFSPPEFNDTTKYRYVLATGSVSGVSQYGGYSTPSFFLEDRMTGERYNGVTSSFFAKLVNAFAINLEKVRAANNKGEDSVIDLKN